MLLQMVTRASALLMAVNMVVLVMLIAFDPLDVAVDLLYRQWGCVILALGLLRLSLYAEAYTTHSLVDFRRQQRSFAWRKKQDLP